jgi:flagellar basal body-associated protein FliL
MLKHTEKEATNKAKPRPFTLLLICGIVLLIGVGLLAWSLFFRSPTRPSAPSVQYSPARPPIVLSAAYENAVKQNLAQQLHLSVSQLAYQIKANQDGLFGDAETRGISDNQLSTILLNAFQSASDQMVSTGQWTTPQATAEMQYWKQRGLKALSGDVTSWLLH